MSSNITNENLVKLMMFLSILFSPRVLRQGVEDETREGNLAPGQDSPSVAKEVTPPSPKIVAASMGLVIPRMLPLKKFAG
jgi:hypothetical protein